MNHEDFVKTLVSDKDKREIVGEEVKKKFLDDVFVQKKQIEILEGVFGEWSGCDGYIEEVIHPSEGGTFCKIYGCSYLFKGYTTGDALHTLDFAKYIFSGFLKEIVGKSFLYMGAVGVKFLFFRKKFLEDIILYFKNMNYRIKWWDIPEKEYGIFVKEIKRAIRVSLGEKLWDRVIKEVSQFVGIFLEKDTAYRFRGQDILGLLDIEKARKNGVKEFFRLLDILISRETSRGISPKWKFMKTILWMVFMMSPELKKIVNDIMRELNPKMLKMDDADWYFCLRWVSYNFGGLSRKERFALRNKIDVEKSHVFLI